MRKRMTQGQLNRNLIVLVAVIVVLGTVYFFVSPAFTGFVVSEVQYSDDVDVSFSSSDTYSWTPEHDGVLKSVQIDGSIANGGSARVYLEFAGERYLIYNSSAEDEEEGGGEGGITSITGLVVGGNNIPEWDFDSTTFVSNETFILNLSDYASDVDGDDLTFSASSTLDISVSVVSDSATISTSSEEDVNGTVAFSASDGSDEVVQNISVVFDFAEESGEGSGNESGSNVTNNTVPIWNGSSTFVVNETGVFNLDSYVYDEDGDSLTYSVSDMDGVAESVDGSTLTLVAEEYDITGTLTVVFSDGLVNDSELVSVIVLDEGGEVANVSEAVNLSIDVVLAYGDHESYDTNDDGRESIWGVVDLDVSDSTFTYDYDENATCTRWEVYNEDDEVATQVCYGADSCCAYVGLSSKRDSWSDAYFATFGTDGTGYNNTISAQIISGNYIGGSQSFGNVTVSSWGEIDVTFTAEYSSFSNECDETCTLAGFNDSSYSIVVELDNGTLTLDTITYVVEEEEDNVGPVLTANVSNVTFSGSVEFNMSDYFSDANGDVLTYSYFETEGITVTFSDDIATMVADANFTGKVFTFFVANDSQLTATSNIFSVNVEREVSTNLTESFVLQDEGGETVAYIDSNGSMFLDGEVDDLEDDLVFVPNSFVVRDTFEQVVSYITDSGDMILEGVVIENSSMTYTGYALEIRNREDEIVALFEDDGDVKLRGQVFERVN